MAGLGFIWTRGALYIVTMITLNVAVAVAQINEANRRWPDFSCHPKYPRAAGDAGSDNVNDRIWKSCVDGSNTAEYWQHGSCPKMCFLVNKGVAYRRGKPTNFSDPIIFDVDGLVTLLSSENHYYDTTENARLDKIRVEMTKCKKNFPEFTGQNLISAKGSCGPFNGILTCFEKAYGC